MSTFFIKALQLILALSFLVVIHEFGHFTFARIFKVRVEKFYMFFNPRFSLVRLKKLGGKWRVKFFAPNVEDNMVERTDAQGNVLKDDKDKPLMRPMTDEELAQLPEGDWRKEPDNTEWGIGWVPLGGYCAISGMVDETTSAGELPSEPQPWEYRSKPTWQRLPIILGGVLVNFIAAMVIYSAVLFHWGEEYLTLQSATDGLYFSELLLNQGFEQHDNIISINGTEPETLSDVVQALIIEGKRDVVVLRGNDTVQLQMSASLGTDFLATQQEFDKQERQKAREKQDYRKENYVLISEYMPFVIKEVAPEMAAQYAGLEAGDRITAINEVETPSLFDVKAELKQHPCDSIQIAFLRGGEQMHTAAFIGDQCTLGVVMQSKYDLFETTKKEYSFFESIPAGISYGWHTLANYVKQFRLVFTKEGSQSLGGFGAIGNLFPPVWDWHSFWLMTAFLSVILAFMNIIPIPGLDGGHVFFLLWEMITGKKPGDKFLERANNIGFWLLLLLLIYANLNDILKLFM